MNCPYCNAPAVKKDSSIIYGRSYGMAYVCSNYPKCDTYVGTHKETQEPLGTMANASLRSARRQTHALFDPLWQSKVFGRRDAYQILADLMKLDITKTHIAMFDLNQCFQAQHLIINIIQKMALNKIKENKDESKTNLQVNESVSVERPSP